MKHVGEYGGKPCVVLFRQVPNEPENCLIVPSAGLENDVHDAIMNTISGPSGQSSNEISEVLQRGTLPDGSNMLSYLHFNGKIVKVAVAQVSLVPVPNQKIPLADVNAELKRLDAGNPPLITEADSTVQPPTTNTLPVDAEGAQGLLVQAELMEQDANRMLAEAEAKKNEAYNLDPSLKPAKKTAGRPKKSAA